MINIFSRFTIQKLTKMDNVLILILIQAKWAKRPPTQTILMKICITSVFEPFLRPTLLLKYSILLLKVANFNVNFRPEGRILPRQLFYINFFQIF